MKSTTSLLTGILILAIGVILIICRSQITGSGIVTVAGILFLVTGIVNLILYVTQKDSEGRKRTRGVAALFGWLVSIATIILGLCMLIFNSTFNSMIAFLFGVLVAFGALMLLYAIVFGIRRVMKTPVWTFIFPLAMAGLAAGIFPQKTGAGEDATVMLLTGISLIVFGVAGIVFGSLIASGNAAIKHEAAVDKKTLPETSKKESPKELKSLDD
ncbi:MAG: DUF308 domain-containing protein [Muribaculaceae bacterium]|nr:DUF308 domain-containing protein [Muribaculaceae bacterium]